MYRPRIGEFNGWTVLDGKEFVGAQKGILIGLGEVIYRGNM